MSLHASPACTHKPFTSRSGGCSEGAHPVSAGRWHCGTGKRYRVYELWRPVPGFESYYAVSDQGRVRSTRTGKLLSPGRDNKLGHVGVIFNVNGVKKHVRVHRLVLLAFVGPQPTGDWHACHGPNGIADNSLFNLYWGTRKLNNSTDKDRDGTKSAGVRNGHAKLTAADIPVIKRLSAQGWNNREIGDLLGVARGTIWPVVNGRTWTHIT